MKKIKKLFEPDFEQMNYRVPVLKILAVVAFWFLGFYREEIIVTDSEPLKMIMTVITVALIIPAMYVFVIAIAEIFEIYGNRHPDSESELQPVKYTQQTILEMAAANDIIEFKVWLNEKPIKLGSSSDYDRKTDKFFDKLYYIGKAEYKTDAEFADALHELNGKKSLEVISIDGVAASKY